MPMRILTKAKQVSNTGSAQVGMAETEYCIVCIIITAARILRIIICIRAKLNESEGVHSAGEVTSRQAQAVNRTTANKGIYILRVVFLKGGLCLHTY